MKTFKIILLFLVLPVIGLMVLQVWLANRDKPGREERPGFPSVEAPPASAAAGPPLKEKKTESDLMSAESSEFADQFSALTQGAVSAVVFPERAQVNVDGLNPELVLERRITDLGGGEVQRLFIVKGGGSYPFHRIKELLRYNPAKDRYEVVRQSMAVADHFIVKLAAGKTEADLQELARAYGVSILKKLSIPGKFIVQIAEPSLDGLLEVRDAFSSETNVVERAYLNSISAPSAMPNDPDWSSLWGKQQIGCPDAWDVTTGSSEIIVAVIDTGVDLDHPDLIDNLWVNPGEIPDNGIDDDGNGYIDDVYGYDFGRDDSDPDDNGDADYDGLSSAGGHGTHCAGIIGAVGNNARQVVGVCWDVQIMVLKPFEYMSAYSNNYPMRVTGDKAEEAMVYAVDHGAKITSNSYGSEGDSQGHYDGISYQNENNVLCVCAAGNDDTLADNHYPSATDLPNVISVGSSTGSETVSSFSNYGATSVDLFAPGSSIYSTVPDGDVAYNSGTSMAAPQVAGALALLYSYQPYMDGLYYKSVVLNSVDTFAEYEGKCVSGGRLNVFHAIEMIRPVLDLALPYTNDFEEASDYWALDAGSTPWFRNSGDDPGLVTASNLGRSGTQQAYAGDYFLMFDAEHNLGKNACLDVLLDLSDYDAVQLNFRYHMDRKFFTDGGRLKVQVTTDVPAQWTDRWDGTTSRDDGWREATVDLSAYAGRSYVKLRFRADIDSLESDWRYFYTLLDNIVLREPPQTGNDLDNDGLPNDWELEYFGGETNAVSDALAANGVNTVLETYILGLDPNDPQAFFKTTMTNPGNFVVRWNATSGRVYSVLGTTNLHNGFQPLETGISWPQSSWTDTVERLEQYYQVDVKLAE